MMMSPSHPGKHEGQYNFDGGYVAYSTFYSNFLICWIEQPVLLVALASTPGQIVDKSSGCVKHTTT